MTTQTADNKTCPVCHGKFTPYPVGNKDSYSLLACRACGSVLPAPWPTAAMLEQYYGDIQPEAVHAANHEALIVKSGKILKKNLPEPAKGKDRLLDVNAQRGYVTAAAQKLGWKATGLNTAEFLHRFAATNYGSNNFVHADLASYAAQTSEKFDAIVAISAFNETADLDAFTAALATLLAPGGVIYIEEPDGNHFNTPRDLSDWAVVEPPITHAIVSKNGLSKLLARHGLALKKSLFTWAPFIRALARHGRKK